MYEEIKEKFKEVIRFSQGIPEPKIESLFDRWELAKKKFIDRFGGLIYEWPEPIEFTLDEKEKKDRAMEFANSVGDNFHNSSLASFIDENLDSFFENKVSNPVGKEIPKGMKLIKAFKYFEEDKSALRSIQDLASQLIQENKVKGTLCFSVHPLDFLSSSENTYNWRSCHALDGDYRAGNLSYMVDETTFMVYLKGGDDQKLYGFGDNVRWNSKKWRMLIHAAKNDDLMFAGRQYPFNSRSGLDIVLRIYNNILLEEIEKKNGYCRWNYRYDFWTTNYIDNYVPDWTTDNEPVYLDTRYLVYADRLHNIKDVIEPGDGSLNYNDVLYSSCYKYPYYSVLNPFGWHDCIMMNTYPIVVGGAVSCLHCGEHRIEMTETMRCDSCELEFGFEDNDTYSSCACCGQRIFLDDAPEVEGDLLCDACCNTECFVCNCCGEVFYNSNKRYVGPNELWYCIDCYGDYLETKEKC